ncbi:hypothetical protein C6P42_000962 [Pichia californica]|nr:hypothetical protein C6P42_000962 [[Candida] californica]
MPTLPVWHDEDANDYQAVSPRQALRVAINLKNLIDTVIPDAVSDDKIKSFDLNLPYNDLMKTVYEAAGGVGNREDKFSSARRYQACLVFCLLKVSGWYDTLADAELANNDIYSARSLFAQKLACIIIDNEKDDKYLFISMLCHRYSINLNDEDSDPENALELGSDVHSLIITTSGYQRCIKWLWVGWIVQSRNDPSEYVLFNGKSNTSFASHFDPDRIQTPLYQNVLEIFVAVLYLILYTFVANIDSIPDTFNIAELILYAFTLGFALDELQRFYHFGPSYVTFSSAFNDTLYSIVFVSLGFRIMSVYSFIEGSSEMYNITSQRFLAVAAPFIWIRMFFFCDLYRFFGVIIVMINTMMKESLIFFFLLSVVIIGFLQAFVGLDQADGKRDLTYFIVTNMLQTILSGPNFKSIERFAYPYGSIMYYSYTFLVTVILLNILIALFSQAYSEVIENANEEYLHQYATRVLKYIRAPDAKIFFPPFNLIEIFFLDIPLSWWMDTTTFNIICSKIMLLLYAPYLCIIANYESKQARRINYNRKFSLSDDSNEENREWLLTDGYEETMNDEANRHIIAQAVERQQNAERMEPEFAQNFPEWKKKLELLVPPVGKASNLGVGVESYEIINHISKLTEKVDVLIRQNNELKKQLQSQK